LKWAGLQWDGIRLKNTKKLILYDFICLFLFHLVAFYLLNSKRGEICPFAFGVNGLLADCGGGIGIQDGIHEAGLGF
jgi:hypothetical protein